ncbi:DUF4267 domain-containing protein [Longispora albida]|uniref:DUF4267 domain-containing protein n=1 Tax=Longispora albida TaxID=203523 RepID=UPI00037B3D6E|nr:DUF4267 domain-containing protein [Longispora albida]
MKKTGIVLATLITLFILYFGTGYLLDGQGNAAGFGLPNPPAGDAGGFYTVKGVRDLGFALAYGVLLVTRQFRALGWVLLVTALVAVGDMTNVLTNSGKTATALGVHGFTAVLVALAGGLLLAGTRTERSAA